VRIFPCIHLFKNVSYLENQTVTEGEGLNIEEKRFLGNKLITIFFKSVEVLEVIEVKHFVS